MELKNRKETMMSEKVYALNLFDVSNIKVIDPGMKRYINLDSKLLVKSQGRIRGKFAKGKINLILCLILLYTV